MMHLRSDLATRIGAGLAQVHNAQALELAVHVASSRDAGGS